MTGFEVGNMQKCYTAFSFGYKVMQTIVFINVARFGHWAFEHERTILESTTTNGNEFTLAGRKTVMRDGGYAGRVLNTSDRCFQSFGIEVNQ